MCVLACRAASFTINDRQTGIRGTRLRHPSPSPAGGKVRRRSEALRSEGGRACRGPTRRRAATGRLARRQARATRVSPRCLAPSRRAAAQGSRDGDPASAFPQTCARSVLALAKTPARPCRTHTHTCVYRASCARCTAGVRKTIKADVERAPHSSGVPCGSLPCCALGRCGVPPLAAGSTFTG